MSCMGIDAKHIDRLLPRHKAANRHDSSWNERDLSWNVRVERTGPLKRHREEVSAAAWICDISLEGALVEVADSSVHEVGDRVAVRFRGLEGRAVIRHCRPGHDGMLLYGVRFLPDSAFKYALDAAVGDLRGHSTELSTVLRRQN